MTWTIRNFWNYEEIEKKNGPQKERRHGCGRADLGVGIPFS
jgi:hypothetical protein